MKKRYLAIIMAFFISSGAILYGCSDIGDKDGAAETEDISSEDISEDESDTSDEESVEKDDSKNSENTAADDAVVEDGWVKDDIYDLNYAIPEYYNLIIDDISDHSETGSYYEKAYDIGSEAAGTIGIHIYAYEKNSGITAETSYSTPDKLVKDHESLEGISYEEVDIPSLDAKVYCGEKVDDDSYLPYKKTYIFEKSADDKYIYEIQFYDMYDESAVLVSFKKSLTF